MQKSSARSCFRKSFGCLIFYFTLCFFSVFYTHNSVAQKPRVSLITSVFDGAQFIRGFLEDTVKLDNFNNYELLLFHPIKSPGFTKEQEVIREYCVKYPNIVYEQLDPDPGIYGVWNLGVKKARAEYVTNANLDDRRNPSFLEQELKVLDENPDLDLVYADYLITFGANETFKSSSYRYVVTATEYAPERMYMCLPGPQPVWRTSMHKKYGYFRSDFHAIGDLEMWNRAACAGAKFKHVVGYSGLFYENPEGLSNTPNPAKVVKRNQEHAFVRGAYKYLWDGAKDQPKVLIKIPTRGRPEQFFKQLDRYYVKLSTTLKYHFLITCDNDDKTMNNPAVIEKLESYPNLTFGFYDNKSKVDAYNRDLEKIDFDVLLVGSDDLEPIQNGYECVIVDAMLANFPDYDGVLNYHDGHVGAACNTYPIVGKKFFERFGYLYHPAYQALSANEELTYVSRLLNKEKVIDTMLLSHNHPVWGLGKWDDTYYRSESKKDQDSKIFKERRAHGFYLSERSYTKDWSILICTIDEREQSFNKLYENLTKQIQDNKLEDCVEILFYKDKRGEHTVGAKRNELVKRAQGKYVSFIDDDDTVHENYVKLIYEKLILDPDCVSLTGVITTNGQDKQVFEHSIKYGTRYGYENNRYIRPPNHLNPIKRSIAVQFKFPETNFGEDQDWALRIARTGLLKKEEVISEIYYFYLYDSNKYQVTQRASPEIKPEIKTETNLVDQKLKALIQAAEKTCDTPFYFCTAADAKYYEALKYFIGSVHVTNFDHLGVILVGNLGLKEEQIDELERMEKVHVVDIEEVNPDMLTNFKTATWGKEVPGWYTWKPAMVKQALDVFPYVIWADTGTIVLKPLDDLFKHVKQNGYFLTTIGNEIDNGKFRHPMRWCTTKRLVDHFDLNNSKYNWILDAEQIMATFFGVSREGRARFFDEYYEMAKDASNFADDGTTPDGFGTMRHDQTVLSLIAYKNNVIVPRQDYTQQKPIYLKVDEYLSPFYITWKGLYVCGKTHVHNARGERRNYKYAPESIRYVVASKNKKEL